MAGGILNNLKGMMGGNRKEEKQPAAKAKEGGRAKGGQAKERSGKGKTKRKLTRAERAEAARNERAEAARKERLIINTGAEDDAGSFGSRKKKKGNKKQKQKKKKNNFEDGEDKFGSFGFESKKKKSKKKKQKAAESNLPPMPETDAFKTHLHDHDNLQEIMGQAYYKMANKYEDQALRVSDLYRYSVKDLHVRIIKPDFNRF